MASPANAQVPESPPGDQPARDAAADPDEPAVTLASTKILVLSPGLVGERMSSIGIRSYQIARVLGDRLPDAEVTLAVPSQTSLPDGMPFRLVRYDKRTIRPLAQDHDIMISYTFPTSLLSLRHRPRIVLDLYGVYLPEWLEIANAELKPAHRKAWFETQRQKLNLLLTLADFILYANERQRHLYLGMLSSLGRVTPDGYAKDKRFAHMLGLVPFGVRPGEPVATRRVLKGVLPGIRESDKLLIWNGATSGWFDLQTLIRAVHRLSLERDDIKLYFMGTELPMNPQPPTLKGIGAGSVQQAMALARELGVLDRSVFFNIGWTGYEDTANFLLEADVGVCTYYPSLETDYSFRTRIVDLFWAERPIVCTEGDVLAEVVARRGLGITVPPEDEEALACAIRRLVDDEAFAQSCRENLHQIKEEYRWEKVLEPLVAFCRSAGPPEAMGRGRSLSFAVRLLGYRLSRLRQLITTRGAGPPYL
jgi:glycosyltransferase involved in cell wall biosynthesis